MNHRVWLGGRSRLPGWDGKRRRSDWAGRRPVYVAAAAAAVIGVMASAMAATPAAADPGPEPVNVTVTQVPLDPTDPSRHQVGELVFRGGLHLASDDPRFGGISALLIEDKGQSFVAASDRGSWITGSLEYAADGTLVSADGFTIEPMVGPAGERLNSQAWWDAESLARAPDGSLVVSFEHVHRLWDYGRPGDRPEAVIAPSELDNAPANGGIEALTTLKDGRLLAISEDLRSEEGVVGWISGPDGSWQSFSYQIGGGFKPTGAATLPGGDVLVLERRFPPLGIRVRRLAADTLEVAAASNAVLEPGTIAEFALPLSIDNMEGIDVREDLDGDGQRFVYMISDDNFSARQRTLLLMFEWVQVPR